MERSSGGIRMFQESDFEWLQVINCMKKAGMSIESPPAGGFCVTLHLPFQEESEERIHAQNHHC